jgi:5'-3' exonuclease
MGIQNLYQVLKKECPACLIKIKLGSLVGYRIAIDISIFLYKFVRTAGPIGWLDLFISLLSCLKKNGIKIVCVFDGKNPPPEKKVEQDRRRAETQKILAKSRECTRLLNLIQKEYIEKRVDLPDALKNEVRKLIPRRKGVPDTINYNNSNDIADGLRITIDKFERQTLPITDAYVIKAKEIIDIMGLSYFQADGEAEALCAYLAVKKEVDAVLTEDTDVLAHGTPLLLSCLDLKNEEVTYVDLNAILASLSLNMEEFRDLCILLSCDYNERVKGYPPDGRSRKKPVGIGAVHAFNMIAEYRRLEEAEKYIVDADPLKYRRCRELFTPPESIHFAIVPYNKPIDKVRLNKFLKENKSKIPYTYLLSTWKPAKLVFDDLEEEEKVEEIDPSVTYWKNLFDTLPNEKEVLSEEDES